MRVGGGDALELEMHTAQPEALPRSTPTPTTDAATRTAVACCRAASCFRVGGRFGQERRELRGRHLPRKNAIPCVVRSSSERNGNFKTFICAEL